MIFSPSSNTGFLAFYFRSNLIYGLQNFIIAALNNSAESPVLLLISSLVTSVLSLKRQRMAAWNTVVMSWYFLGVKVICNSTWPYA